MERKQVKAGQTIIVKKIGSNSDIISALHYYMPYAVQQNQKRKFLFQGKTEKEICQSIWQFLKDNIKYVEDSIYYQDIRLPNRLLKDRKGDCKSYAMFTASLLKSLNIPCKLVYTSYTASKTPSHVYCQTDSGIIIDAVWNKFNSEKPYTYKYLKRI